MQKLYNSYATVICSWNNSCNMSLNVSCLAILLQNKSICLLAGRQSLTCEVLRGPTIIHQYGWAAKMKTLLGSVTVTLQNRFWWSITKEPDYSKADQSGEEAFLEASCVAVFFGQDIKTRRIFCQNNLMEDLGQIGNTVAMLWIAGLQPAPKAGAIESVGPSCTFQS